MISLRTSTGKSSNFSGPVAAFALPFGALWATTSTGDARTALVGSAVTTSTSAGSLCVAVACPSFCAAERAQPSSSSDGDGDSIVGVVSGEEAMVCCRRPRAGRRHSPSRCGRAKRETGQDHPECRCGVGGACRAGNDGSTSVCCCGCGCCCCVVVEPASPQETLVAHPLNPALRAHLLGTPFPVRRSLHKTPRRQSWQMAWKRLG
jgi:hypothetical protein